VAGFVTTVTYLKSNAHCRPHGHLSRRPRDLIGFNHVNMLDRKVRYEEGELCITV
jgi:hypothetical protein